MVWLPSYGRYFSQINKYTFFDIIRHYSVLYKKICASDRLQNDEIGAASSSRLPYKQIKEARYSVNACRLKELRPTVSGTGYYNELGADVGLLQPLVENLALTDRNYTISVAMHYMERRIVRGGVGYRAGSTLPGIEVGAGAAEQLQDSGMTLRIHPGRVFVRQVSRAEMIDDSRYPTRKLQVSACVIFFYVPACAGQGRQVAAG